MPVEIIMAEDNLILDFAHISSLLNSAQNYGIQYLYKYKDALPDLKKLPDPTHFKKYFILR